MSIIFFLNDGDYVDDFVVDDENINGQYKYNC